VLATTHLTRPFCADLVIAGIHLPTKSALVDVVDPHVTVEETTAGRPIALNNRCHTYDECDDNCNDG